MPVPGPRRAAPPGPASTEAGTLAKLMWAIGQHESGGSYSAVNSSSGALGKWQVLPSNVPSWTQQALGHSLTPSQFLHSPQAQNQTVAHIMGQYLRQYGVAGTIAAWYGGPGVARNQASWDNPVPGGPTIRQYVDDILSRMGRAPSGITAPPGVPYRNPLRGIRGLTASRVDMGVDYGGTGPIYALGPGVITEADTAWAGGLGTGPGTFITERLTAGPLKGRYVYTAEHITPQVKRGQRVTAGTVIGQVSGGIETGFAVGPSSPGTTLAMQAGQTPPSGDPGAHPTAFGAAYSKILGDLGAPAGVASGPPVGQLPGWLQGVLHAVSLGSNIPGAASGLSGVAGAIQGIGDWLNGLSTAIDWLLNPSNWVRILAGLAGGTLVLGGIVTLSHVGESYRGPLTSRPMALPVGILMVGAGGVLLFVAFHNLPGSPANVGELLGSLRDEAQTTAQGQAVAA